MLDAGSHATMMDVYSSVQEGPETSWSSRETAGSEGFCITFFTSPAGSLPEHPTFGTFSSGISPAQLLYYTGQRPW
jgi:hypothetical protein